MSLEAIATLMIGSTAIIAWLGWQMVDSPNDWVNQLGSFLVIISINFLFSSLSTAFLIIENVPYAYLTNSYLAVISVGMWVTIIIASGYFLRIVFNLIKLLFNILKASSRTGHDAGRSGGEDRSN